MLHEHETFVYILNHVLAHVSERVQSPFHARISVIIIIIVIIGGFSTRVHSLSILFSLLARQQEIPAGERYSDRRAISVNNVLLLRHGSDWLYTYETNGQACIKAYHNGSPLSRRQGEAGVVRGRKRKRLLESWTRSLDRAQCSTCWNRPGGPPRQQCGDVNIAYTRTVTLD